MARPWIAIAWLAGLAACAAWLHQGLQVSTEMTMFLPPSATPTQRLLAAQLREGPVSRLALVAVDPDPAASREMARRLRASGEFATVGNGDLAAFARERALLLGHRYLLSPAVTPERFGADGLREALQANERALASPAGALLRQTMARDPTGELRELARLMVPASGPAQRGGVWMARDGSRALLLAETRAPGFDVDGQRRAVRAIDDAWRASFAGRGRLELAGPGVFASQIRESIEAEAWRLSLASTALVVAILLIAYRSLGVVAACALPVITGLLVGIAAVAAGFGTVHGITLAFGATLIGETVDYPSYIFTHVQGGEPLDATLARIGPTLLLAVLTTMLGALAMALSSFGGLAQLGVLTIAGVAAASFVTFWLLPRVIPTGALRAKLLAVPMLPALAPQFIRRARWAGLALVAASAVTIAASHTRLWNDDLASLSPIPEAAKALDQRLRTELGAPDVRFLMVARAADQEAALEASESLAAWLAGQVAAGRLAGFEVPSTYLPSRRTQEARRAALPNAAALESNLKAALRSSGFRGDAFAPFLADVARARAAPPLAAADLEGTAFGLKVASLLVRNEDGWAALAPLRGVGAAPELAAAAKGAGFEFLDLKEQTTSLINAYRGETLQLVAWGFAGIVALLVVMLRSARRAARVLVPVLGAVLVDVAVLLLLGRALSLFNLVALLLVVGVGLKYALFFERPQRDDAEGARTRLSVAVCAATTLSVFGCLMLSATPALSSIGETVFFGCLACAPLCALLAGSPPRGHA